MLPTGVFHTPRYVRHAQLYWPAGLKRSWPIVDPVLYVSIREVFKDVARNDFVNAFVWVVERVGFFAHTAVDKDVALALHLGVGLRIAAADVQP